MGSRGGGMGRPVNYGRIEDYHFMRDSGATKDQIARAFGIKRESLERWLLRHGL